MMHVRAFSFLGLRARNSLTFAALRPGDGLGPRCQYYRSPSRGTVVVHGFLQTQKGVGTMSKRHPTPFFRSLPRSAFLATGLKSLHTAFTGGRGRSPMPSRDTLIPCHKSPLPSSFPHMLLGRVGTHQQLRPFQKIPSRLWPPAKDNKKAVSLLQLTACFYCGAPEEIRTPGLQVRSLLLYPAELRARREKLCIAIALPCQILSAKKINFYAAAIAGPRF